MREVIIYESNEMYLHKKNEHEDYSKSVQLILGEIQSLRVDLEQKIEDLKRDGRRCPQYDGSMVNKSSPREVGNHSIRKENEDFRAIPSTKNRIKGDDALIDNHMLMNHSKSKSTEDRNKLSAPSVAMHHPSDQCMFDNLCREKPIDLYVKDSQFQLYTSHFGIGVPESPVCNRAFIFTSMPYSNSHTQMIIVRLLMKHFRLEFRSYVYWNWHAHAKLTTSDSLIWSEKMTEFIGSLEGADELIIEAQYKDDKAVKNLCEKSVVIHEMRSLEDIALLRFHGYYDDRKHHANEEYKIEVLDAQRIIDYIRSILMHQRFWEKNANVLLSKRQFEEDGGLAFTKRICRDFLSLPNNDLCTNTLLLEILSNDEVRRSKALVKRQNEYLAQLYNNIKLNQTDSSDSAQIMTQIQVLFRAWTASKISSQFL